ncbi:MAG: hypothetical protein M2R45_02804 [Verrucomicrobia subdivision 3 bacterium]|nr:hypothetical protein [Limisphaerales bacterium]MCS1414356.1 hypothetical protein [Limisphaerales bacterium]
MRLQKSLGEFDRKAIAGSFEVDWLRANIMNDVSRVLINDRKISSAKPVKAHWSNKVNQQ